MLIAIIVLVVLVLLVVGAFVMKELFERERKVLQMKRFQRETRGGRVEFTEADKRTMS